METPPRSSQTALQDAPHTGTDPAARLARLARLAAAEDFPPSRVRCNSVAFT